MSSYFAPIRTPEVKQPIRRPRRVRPKLKPFCTKEAHAKLRFDRIRVCPVCNLSTKEPWGCPCHQDNKLKPAYKARIGAQATQEHKEWRKRYWRDVGRLRRQQRYSEAKVKGKLPY